MKTILFNNKFGLRDAILEMGKTMTRRSISDKLLEDAMFYGGNDADKRDEYLIEHARYKVDEVVAIAQSYESILKEYDDYCNGLLPSWIRDESYDRFFKALQSEKLKESGGWKNQMFVNAAYMPHHIRILDIRVEYLQEIDVIDAKFEGIELCAYKGFNGKKCLGYEFTGCDKVFDSPIDAFACLIDKISGNGTWKRNPLVYVYSFEVLD